MTEAGTLSRGAVKTDAESQGAERILLVFDLVGEYCGLDVNMVREIVHVPPSITRVPNAPSYVRGVINLRGTVIPVLDMAVKMGNAPSQKTSDSRIVVAEYQDILFGVLVDAVREVRTIHDGQVESGVGTDVGIGRDYVQGVAKLEDGRLIVLLDLAGLFDIDDLVQEEEGEE
jgi:purine-binding chemotaxis protein CheW